MKKLSFSLFTLLLSVVFLSGCDALTGKEVARLPINQVSRDDNHLIIKDTSINLKKGDEVGIWSDMDIHYEGDIGLMFKMQILKDGQGYGHLEFDPTDKYVTLGEIKKSLMGKTDWSFFGKNSKFKVEESGNYTFKGILIATDNPSLIINKAEVVLEK